MANWLWQGSALAAATTVILRLLPRLSATARYRVWWVALAAVLALPVLHWLPARPIGPPAAAVAAASPYNVEMPLLPWWPVVTALVAYLAWTAWSLGRIGCALLHLRAAKRRCRDLSLRRQNRLPRWIALRDRGRRARLVVSDDVRSASLLGLTSPAIAVSPALLRALEDDELDCILMHEWAHVQRRDDVARLVQVAVRAIAGLHPGIWWIDRQLHIDRETACDDWAINLIGSARRYAACLTRLAALGLASGDAVLLPTALSPADLTRRVVRLLDRRRSMSTKRPVAATALAVPLLTALAMVVAGIQLVVPPDSQAMLVVGRSPVAALQVSPMRVARPLAVAPAPGVRPPVPRRQHAEPGLATAAATPPTVAAPDATEPSAPSSAAQTLDLSALQTIGEAPGVTPLPAFAVPVGEPSAVAVVPAPLERKPATPWGMVADTGVKIGRGSQEGAVATAGFFSRLGKSIARSF